MAVPLLLSSFFLEIIWPFVLVFTLIFAILQKTQLLGEGKKQIDAMIGLVVAIMLVAFPPARDTIVLLMPFFAVSAVILLVFMLLYGFIAGKKEGDVLNAGWKIALISILALAIVTYLLISTGYWDKVWMLFFSGGGSVFTTVIMIVVIVGVIIAVIKGER